MSVEAVERMAAELAGAGLEEGCWRQSLESEVWVPLQLAQTGHRWMHFLPLTLQTVQLCWAVRWASPQSLQATDPLHLAASCPKAWQWEHWVVAGVGCSFSTLTLCPKTKSFSLMALHWASSVAKAMQALPVALTLLFSSLDSQ